MKNVTPEFQPFGEEWKKEVTKLPKPFLINMWAKSAKESSELKEQNRGLVEALTRINQMSNSGSDLNALLDCKKIANDVITKEHFDSLRGFLSECDVIGIFGFRPKSLRGIDDNNGWNITSEKLPEDDKVYIFLRRDGQEIEREFSLQKASPSNWKKTYTHWRDKIEYPKPLY